MTYLRAFILVLLTVLLPVRGAVAAAMLCPGGMQTSSPAAATVIAHHDAHGGHVVDAQPSVSRDHAHEHFSDETSSDSHVGACPFCSGGCCVTPLAFGPPSVQGPLLSASAAFPPLTARVPAHDPDGRDRPPRTI